MCIYIYIYMYIYICVRVDVSVKCGTKWLQFGTMLARVSVLGASEAHFLHLAALDLLSPSL